MLWKFDSRITYAAAVWGLNENRLKNYQYITNKNLLKFAAYCEKKEAVKSDDRGW
jgi:hypothetical protein